MMSCGCLSRQVANDGMGVRQAILDMYTDQIMDNLIRAKNNLPFVQLKYSSIQVNDQHDLTSTGALDQTVTTVRNLILAGAMRTVAVDAKGSVTGDCKRTMNFTADPVTDSNDVYDKYIDFAKKHLFATDRKPQFAVHIIKRCGHLYYWVPCDAAEEFLKLCMDTTFKRGKADTTNVMAAYEVTVVGFDKVNDYRPKRDALDAVLIVDPAVPNGSATLFIQVTKDRKAYIELLPDPASDIAPGKPTTRFKAFWAPKQDGLELEQLKGSKARIYSQYFPPEIQGPPPALTQINTNLNSILVQLQNQAKPK
jgi:hypothetical protein